MHKLSTIILINRFLRHCSRDEYECRLCKDVARKVRSRVFTFFIAYCTIRTTTTGNVGLKVNKADFNCLVLKEIVKGCLWAVQDRSNHLKGYQ
jgi:hypothetical protein